MGSNWSVGTTGELRFPSICASCGKPMQAGSVAIRRSAKTFRHQTESVCREAKPVSDFTSTDVRIAR